MKWTFTPPQTPLLLALLLALPLILPLIHLSNLLLALLLSHLSILLLIHLSNLLLTLPFILPLIQKEEGRDRSRSWWANRELLRPMIS